jgi:hypothetical protein
VPSFVLVDALRLGLDTLVDFLAGAVFVGFLAAGLTFLEDTSGFLDFLAADVLLTAVGFEFFPITFFADARPLTFPYYKTRPCTQNEFRT